MTGPLVISHPASYLHHPPDHPERPERIAAIESAIAADPGLLALPSLQLDLPPDSPVPGAAEGRRLAATVHDDRHVDAMFAAGAEAENRGAGAWLDADTYFGPGTLEAACAALLSSRAAVEAVLSGDTSSAFSFCRPPGHHATRRQAMGFCIFNNVAAAAQYALDAGLERVAIVDFDVHHGNGTQDVFYERADVLYISTHQWPLYPGTGAVEEQGRGEGEGFTVNVPLPAGCGDRDYVAAFDDAVLPAIDRYAPELILVSAGFDAHSSDPLAAMEVTTAGFGSLARRLLGAAERNCSGRSAWILEGGYDLQALGSGAAACLQAASQNS
ncbi:MAG: histone deacetylase [Candidatus Dormibacteria bacterium]